MTIKRQHPGIFFLLFTLSGFSGLIYESIWTHYLKLFLGHAAYAQTLVLAIFMGGMAIGSWVCSRYSSRWRNLLIGYAVAEGIVGLCALLFQPLYTGVTDLSYAAVIPRLGNPVVVSAYKWAIASLLILPQSVLLGMTFPLMSAGILRLFPDRPGRTIGLLYFTNSIGAAVGVLVSGFVLIRLIGLPGTIGFAGVINIALAMTVWYLAKGGAPVTGASPVSDAPQTGNRSIGQYRLFLLASLVTGLASFIYEIGWIRMLSLVLGTSTHAFELMLSAFILGLACGGLWIQRRIDRITLPVRFLARVQVIMGLLALSTLLLYGNAFEVMRLLVQTLPKTAAGYGLFNLASSAIAIAVMLPATFCAGMTLPLITCLLLKDGHGEKSIGAVYAANTVGAIIGIFFAIHVGMPQLGLKGLIICGASLDIALGIGLFWWGVGREEAGKRPLAITATGIGAVAATLLFVQLDPYKMASGVYRQGKLTSPETHRLLSHRDGKTATVSCVLTRQGMMSLRTNGKSDAAIMTAPDAEFAADETTMVLLAAIPMVYNPAMKTAAAIGLGSGLTSHTLLSNPALQQVDTVEIEREIIAAANHFRPRVERVFSDPRSRIYNEDAKTFFSTWNKRYDLIVSEPSNPWVSGVAGLFSEEFYRLAARHLNDDGLFVQWVQLYENNNDLVASVLKAISSSFPDYAVYASNRADMMIIARKKGQLPEPAYQVLNTPELSASLRRINVKGEQDLALMRIGSKKFFERLLQSFDIRANSDYYPVLDQNAGRARFLESTAMELPRFQHLPVPLLEMLDGRSTPRTATNVTYTKHFDKAQETVTAMALRDYFLTGRFGDLPVNEELKKQAIQITQVCRGGDKMDRYERLGTVFSLTVSMAPYLTPAELNPLWKLLESGSCATDLTPWDQQWYALFRAVGNRDARRMLDLSRLLLESKEESTPIVRKYLLAAGMTGAIALKERNEAKLLWDKYGRNLFGAEEPDLLFRLLAAESEPVGKRLPL